MAPTVVNVVLCLVIPLLLLCGILDKHNRHLILALVTGCFICLLACWLNSGIYQATQISYFTLTTTVAPICEETLKCIPIAVYALVFSHDRNRIVPTAFAVGIGFAIGENAYFFVQNTQDATIIWLLLRGFGAGLMHGLASAMLGYGLYRSVIDRRLIAVGMVASLFLVIMFHGAYNCLMSSSATEYLGVLLPLFTYGAFLLVYYRQKVIAFFTSES